MVEGIKERLKILGTKPKETRVSKTNSVFLKVSWKSATLGQSIIKEITTDNSNHSKIRVDQLKNFENIG